MALPRVLVLVLAGGAGGRLELLTEQRAKPAVPFAGVYRLIDFPLSNCQHSNLADVWVSVQYHPTSLSQHLANGRPWDLDRTTGGLLVLQPRQGNDDRGGFQQGTADAIWLFAVPAGLDDETRIRGRLTEVLTREHSPLADALLPAPVADAGAGHGGALLRVTVTDRAPETVVLQTLVGRLGLAVEVAGGSVETVAGGRYGRLLLRVTGDLDRLDAAVRGLRDDGVLVEHVPAGAGLAATAGGAR